MGLKVLIILFSLQAQATNLYKEDFKGVTEVTQIQDFYDVDSYSDRQRCQVAKWVHENNSSFVRKMYAKGYKIHPNRLQRTSDDVKSHCQEVVTRKKQKPVRCRRFENCLHEPEIYRLLIDR
ncbi:MAG: hypothetical protein MK008_06320 [Bdellovibrionales bacterium]|nr:hypothetical protein [Bdellovibrionales bacterium]